MLTDIEIAQSCEMQPIGKIADKLNIPEEMLEPYGRYKAKVDHIALKDLPQKGKLVLVTAINPTPAGEGKTTVSIGLADALRLEGYNACLALREPSLGPVFGVKGGADEARRFADAANGEVFSLLANVGDAKSLIIHPASTTHSQLSEEDLRKCGISPEMIRLSIGIEHIDDIIGALDEAFAHI